MTPPKSIEQMRAEYYARYPDAPRHRGGRGEVPVDWRYIRAWLAWWALAMIAAAVLG